MDGCLASSKKRKVILTKVVMYTTGFCPYCVTAKRIFDDSMKPRAPKAQILALLARAKAAKIFRRKGHLIMEKFKDNSAYMFAINSNIKKCTATHD